MSRVQAPAGDRAPGDVIDFTVLASSSDTPRRIAESVEIARELCRPWLHPTGEVLWARLARHLEAGRIEETTPSRRGEVFA